MLSDSKASDKISYVKGIIDECYMQTVDALNAAAHMCIPVLGAHVLKSWWSSSLSELKRQAIASHNQWVEAGKPRSGSIYLNRSTIKLKYKLAINKF